MKVAGWILLVIGCLSFFGNAINGNSLVGSTVFIALGAYFIHNANQKKEDEKKKKQWEDGGQEGDMRN